MHHVVAVPEFLFHCFAPHHSDTIIDAVLYFGNVLHLIKRKLFHCTYYVVRLRAFSMIAIITHPRRVGVQITRRGTRVDEDGREQGWQQ